jgi:hypothetical protein
VSNWIDSGGVLPRPWTDEDWENPGPESRQGRGWRWRTPLNFAFAVVLLGLASQLGHARDHGQFGNANPDLRARFNALKSGKGRAVPTPTAARSATPIGRAATTTTRVRIDGEWVNVPDEAVITEPIRVGRTTVWPIRDGVDGLYIRCFMPGSMT